MNLQIHRRRWIAATAAAAAICFMGSSGWLGVTRAAGDDATPQVSADTAIKTGENASLHGKMIFPVGDPWNTDISKAPVDPNSNVLITGIGSDAPLHPDFGASLNGKPFGIPYDVVAGTQHKVPVKFGYADQSDPGPYPIPANAPIEGGPKSTGDRHVLIVDKDHWVLYELYDAFPVNGGASWRAGSGAIFNMKIGSVQRPAGWTSADAAGLPMLPGLARYDEVVGLGKVDHALRFTVQYTRRAYVSPARHFASSNTSANLPPMGMRVRLKASYNISGYPPMARIILQGLKTYGMILADNGSDWFISGTPDRRWNDDDLNTLKKVTGSDLEVVKMGQIVTSD